MTRPIGMNEAATKVMKDATFKLRQDGVIVAEGSARDASAVIREALHYASVYAQDGPVTLTIFLPKSVSGMNEAAAG